MRRYMPSEVLALHARWEREKPGSDFNTWYRQLLDTTVQNHEFQVNGNLLITMQAIMDYVYENNVSEVKYISISQKVGIDSYVVNMNYHTK